MVKVCKETSASEVLTSFHKRRVWHKSCLFKCGRSCDYSSWWQPCEFYELSAVGEFYLLETTFILWIKSSCCVPTALCSVYSASYPSSKRLPSITVFKFPVNGTVCLLLMFGSVPAFPILVLP